MKAIKVQQDKGGVFWVKNPTKIKFYEKLATLKSTVYKTKIIKRIK